MASPGLDLFQGVVPFVTAAELSSVRGAARRLAVTPSAVSKAISKLEENLGVRLLDRSARAVRLTPEGQSIFEQYRQAMARAMAARDLAGHAQHRPQGTLRVSAPLVLGRVLLAAGLADFYERYPALSVELELTDRLVQFAQENVDVALRIGRLGDSQAKVRRLMRTRWVTVASPGYLARHGPPECPADLAAHQCLRFLAPDGRPRDWTFTGRDGQQGVEGRLVANDGEALVAAAVAGIGVVQAMGFMVRPALARGELVEVLADYAAEGPSIYVLSAPGRARAARVKAFLDLVRELFAGT